VPTELEKRLFNRFGKSESEIINEVVEEIEKVIENLSELKELIKKRKIDVAWKSFADAVIRLNALKGKVSLLRHIAG